MENLSIEACQLFYNQSIEKINFDTKMIKDVADELCILSKISVLNDFVLFCLKLGLNISTSITEYEKTYKINQTKTIK
jgi:hypothetical protein